jgi:hypothetical protein
MVGLLFYALLVTQPPVAYIVGVLAAAAVTGWAAFECLLGDWADRSGDGHPVRRPRRRHRGSLAGRGLARLDRSTRLSDPSKSSARIYGTHRLSSDAHRLGDGRQTVTPEPLLSRRMESRLP